ncbi:MAG: helix-turn-helix transcriptional regulator [Oligoflexales bacterium]|nr:helix-turn-helix transcriptional regulator [Oligoflexales bacterium]
MSKIAEQIRSMRKSRKLTQKELALQSGVSFSFINQLERGKASVRLDIVNQLAEMFGYEVQLVKMEPRDIDLGDDGYDARR